MLVELKYHCSRLVDILGKTELVCEWERVAEWLQLAAALKNIEVDLIQFDDGFGFCENADKYSLAKEELMRRFVSELSRFSFVWGGLESCLDSINPPKHPDKSRRGKINGACYYPSEYYEMKPLPDFLQDEISAFRSASSLCFGYSSVEKRFTRYLDAGSGLFAVYEIRNLFAHGSLEFPEPNSRHQPISHHQSMVSHATRIVLISIQMLLLAYFEHSDFEIPYSWNQDLCREQVPLWIALSSCHLAHQDAGAQMLLF